MELAKLLEEAKQEQLRLVDQINQLEQQRQTLLQEAFRLEGEIRLLQRLEMEAKT